MIVPTITTVLTGSCCNVCKLCDTICLCVQDMAGKLQESEFEKDNACAALKAAQAAVLRKETAVKAIQQELQEKQELLNTISMAAGEQLMLHVQTLLTSLV